MAEEKTIEQLEAEYKAAYADREALVQKKMRLEAELGARKSQLSAELEQFKKDFPNMDLNNLPEEIRRRTEVLAIKLDNFKFSVNFVAVWSNNGLFFLFRGYGLLFPALLRLIATACLTAASLFFGRLFPIFLSCSQSPTSSLMFRLIIVLLRPLDSGISFLLYCGSRFLINDGFKMFL